MKRILLVLACAAALPACGDSNGGTTGPTPSGEPLVANIEHRVDMQPLAFDSTEYVNAAGNKYTVSRLEYYLSGVIFQPEGGAPHSVKGAFYVNAADPQTMKIDLGAVPAGNYESVQLFIGLDDETNVTGGLPNTKENVDMAWPEHMGGGYHFLKCEGHYQDPNAATVGYAMHMGGNETRITVTIAKAFTLAKDSPSLTLAMNLDEWYQNPHEYNFDVDGNYTMHDDVAKQKLKENGADVFTME